MAKKPTAKPTSVAPAESPAPAAKSTPKRLIATRPPAGRTSKTSPVPKDATKTAPAPAPAVVPTPAAVVAPPKPAAAKPAPAAAKPVKAAPAKKPVVKPIKLTSSRKKAPAAPAAPRVITNEDIAVRAYLIAEQRQRNGIWGEPHHDWIEAERQLQAELIS